MKRFLQFIIVGLFLCPLGVFAGGLLLDSHRFGGGSSYTDIIGYHDANAKDDLNKSGGSATVTYTANFDLATDNGETPILGTDSWDQDNDGYDHAYFETSGNIDFSGGRIGFYFEPLENAAGRLVYTSTNTDGSDPKDFDVKWLTPDDLQISYMGTTENFTDVNFSTGTAYFLEFKFTGDTLELFVDGVSQGTVVGSGTPDDTYIFFGAFDGNAVDGLYDQIICTNDEDRDLNAIKDVTNFD